MRVPFGIVVATCLLLLSLAPAQVYRWEDREDTRHFTNAPVQVPESYRAQIEPLPAPVVFPGEPSELPGY